LPVVEHRDGEGCVVTAVWIVAAVFFGCVLLVLFLAWTTGRVAERRCFRV
jgi:hypothetical protein